MSEQERIDLCDHEPVNALKITAALVIGMLLGGSFVYFFIETLK